jgi:hypothetical protein
VRRFVLVCSVVLLLVWWGSYALVQSSSAQQLLSHLSTLVPLGSQPDAGASTVTGPPTISAAFIDRVLSAYGSPAAGTGQALYDGGVQDGIDPVYALAFFQHEDSFGRTGWGAVNQSLGNSRCSGWPRCQGGYRYYPTWADGYQDWYNLILNGYVRGQVSMPIVGHACTTVDEIVPVYAPSSDHVRCVGTC